MRRSKCARCHYVVDYPIIVRHVGKKQSIPLCKNCYRFIVQLFDDVIDEYVLRKE